MDSPPPSQPLRLTGDDPFSGLTAWLADSRVDAAAAERARQRRLERQSAEDATIVGLLIDLAERGSDVAVRTTAGRTVRGRVVAVGADFVAIRDQGLGDVVVPGARIATIRTKPGERSAVGDRPPAREIGLGAALVELCADHPSVLVGVAGEEIRGALRRAGRDIVTVMLDGPVREEVHVALGSIDHLVVLSR